MLIYTVEILLLGLFSGSRVNRVKIYELIF